MTWDHDRSHPSHNPQWHNLSPEDRRILEEAHANQFNPQHPAHKDHSHHHEFVKGLVQRFGGALVFGAGATAGGDIVNSLFGR